MLRRIAAVVAGVVVLGAVVFGLQAVVGTLHPLPDGLDPRDPAQEAAFQAWVAELPLLVWVLGFGSEILGAFAGALTAGTVAREGRRAVAATVVGLSLLASMLNWNMFAHPEWFIVGQLLAYPLVLWAALVLVGRGGLRERTAAPAT